MFAKAIRLHLRHGLGLVLAALLLAVPASGQRNKKTFAETTDVTVVEVPVTVVHDGEPMTGLTKDDFELLDGKKKQEIVGFEVVNLQNEEITRMPEALPPAARRHFLILFDLSFSRPEALVKARWAARDLVDQLHPTDLAGVGIYSATRGADFLLGFTTDRRQLEMVIASLGSPKLMKREADPLGLLFGDVQNDVPPGFFANNSLLDTSEGGRASAVADEKAEAMAAALEEGLESDMRMLAQRDQLEMTDRVKAMTRSMSDMANVLGSIDGLKHVVYLSEGFSEEVLIGEARDVGDVDAIAEGRIWEQTGDDAYGNTGLQNDFEKMIEEFRRAGCTVQAIDIAGLRAAGRGDHEQTSLLAFASGTGGELYRNLNDLGLAMEKMLLRTSVTYLLAFQPQNLKMDGKYHKIKVKLRDAPRGARLSHRAGYYAPDPGAQVNPIANRFKTAERLFSDDAGDFGLAVMAAPFAVEGEDPYVPVLVEVDGPGLLAGQDDVQALSLELYAYAIAKDGAVLDFFSQNLALDLGQTRGALAQRGFKYWGHFDLPPGEYTARVMVKDAQGGRHAVARRALRVPSFATEDGGLQPPWFGEPPGTWVMAREGADRQRDVPYPFMVDGAPVIPACKPVVPKKGKTPFHVQGLNLVDAKLSFEVLGADGTAVDKASASGGPGAAELVTKGLAPGEYTLVAKAASAAGTYESSIPFVVR